MKYNGKNRKFFLDMDGVSFDFGGARDALGMTSQEFKMMPGAYRNLKPYPGVVDNVLQLIDWGWDVWIATKIPDENPLAATEKLFSIHEHMPFLKKSVIITPNKGTLGGKLDFLLDDRPHKAHCDEFQGTLLTYGFDNEFKSWDQVMDRMSRHCPDANVVDEVLLAGKYVPIRDLDQELFGRPRVLVEDLPESVRERVLVYADYHNRSLFENSLLADYVYGYALNVKGAAEC